MHKVRFTAITTRTQLIKLVTRSTSTKKITVPARTGHQYAVDVQVDAGTRISTSGGVTTLSTGGQGGDGPFLQSYWFDASVLTAVPGQPLLGYGDYADRVFAGVGKTVRIHLTPQTRSTVDPQPLVPLAVQVSGAPVEVPAEAKGGAVVTVDASGLAHPYATVLGLTGTSWTARTADGRESPRGGRVVGVSGDRLVLLLSGESAGRTFRLVPTPVHPQKLVGGDSVRVPADPDGLETLVTVDTAGVMYADATVHAAPSGSWSVTYGYPIAGTPPRGCNGCGEDMGTITTLGKHTAYSGGYVGGGGVRVLLSTGGRAAEGYFEVSLTDATRR